jgi:hypothetical protein
MQVGPQPNFVIASEAKQSRAAYWAEIASSRYALLAMTAMGTE